MTFFYRFVRGAATLYAKLFYRVEFHGRENEPGEGPLLVISNHSSFTDPVFTACALKRQIHFMAKSDLEKHGFLRFVFKHAGVYTVNRGESDLRAMRISTESLAKGECIGIYPQGTRMPGVTPSKEQSMAGIGLIAKKQKPAVLPVTICYGSNPKPIFGKKVHVYIGKPLNVGELLDNNPELSSKEISEHLFSLVCNDFAEHNNG